MDRNVEDIDLTGETTAADLDGNIFLKRETFFPSVFSVNMLKHYTYFPNEGIEEGENPP